MKLFSNLFNRRVRGVRLVEILACGCLAILVLSVYLTKAAAGRESAALAATNREIDDEQRRLRLLKAELAHLEQPARLEQLSSEYLAMGPVSAKRETVPDSLTELARQTGGSRR